MDHLRGLDRRRTLADRKLRDQRREVERTIEIHPARNHLVDGVSQLIAADAVRPGIASNTRAHRRFFLRARDAGLDCDVANDRLIVRRDRGRHRDRGGQLHGIADHAASRLPTSGQPLVTGRLQIQPARRPAEPRVRAIEPVDLDAGIPQRFQIAVELATDAIRRTIARQVQSAELVLQTHRLADLALPEPRVVRPLLHRIDLRRRVGNCLAERRRHSPADHDAKR
ncbi:hypothetical protein ABIC50_004695 [Burkholderia sp. 567]